MSRLAKRFTARPGASMRSAAKEEADQERRRKNNRLCVAMVVIFGTCWLPLNLINFVADINVIPIYCWRYHHFTFFLCHVLAMSSNCYNPFLYGWLNDAFREEFLRMLPFLATVCGGKGNEGNQEDNADGENGGQPKVIERQQLQQQQQQQQTIPMVERHEGEGDIMIKAVEV